MRILDILGWLLANICGALVYLPMIIIFIIYALIEVAATGKYVNADNISKRLGKAMVIPIWKVRTFNGLVPFEKPDGMK